MPKLEINPSREGRGENDREGGDRRVQIVPPLSDFNSDLNIVQWRLESLRPLLHGPENDPSASGELMLNGSRHFEQVYGSGAEGEAFRSSVEGTFQFVTNLTRYHDSSASLDVAQSGGSEAAGTEPSGTEPVLSAEGDGDALQSSSNMTPRRHSLAADGDISLMRHSLAVHSTMQSPSSGLLAPQSSQLRSSSLPSMGLPQNSVGVPAASNPNPPQGFEVLLEQQSTDLPVLMIEESVDIFETGEERRGQGRGSVLPSYSVLIQPVPRRRYHSIEVLSH